MYPSIFSRSVSSLIAACLLTAGWSLSQEAIRTEPPPRARVVDGNPAPSKPDAPAAVPEPAAESVIPEKPGPKVDGIGNPPNPPNPASGEIQPVVSRGVKPAAAASNSGKFLPEPAKSDADTILRVQIFLDEHNFGPGKLDGEIGEFTRMAAAVYNEAHQLEKGNWFVVITAAQRHVSKTLTTYELKANDFRFLVPGLPEKPEAQKDYKYMGYRTIEEFVAERYHTSEAYIYKINPGVRFSKLKAGDKVIVPNVTSPFVIETVPYSQAYAKDDALSARKVLLDTKKRIARFFDQKGILMASFPITPGKDKFIKPGEFSLVNMVTTPEFRWDKAMLEKGERSEEYFQLPPGPNSPVGIFWASTSRKGIGLHGTSTPHTIGRSQSAGCIRFANWDAVRLPSLIRPGTKLVMQ